MTTPIKKQRKRRARQSREQTRIGVLWLSDQAYHEAMERLNAKEMPKPHTASSETEEDANATV